MARKLLVSTLLGASILSACSSVPVATSPDDSSWRLRNFLDNGLSETVRVYNFCYNGKETGFVAARDFEPGSHTVVTKITQTFNTIESEPKEAYATLNGDFVAGILTFSKETFRKIQQRYGLLMLRQAKL